MRYAAAILLLGVFIVTPHAAAREEWRPLFNGVDLDGWTQIGPGRFVVENSVLRTQGGMGLLWYEREQFENTTLRIVYRVPDPNGKGNSGVFIRIPAKPTESMGRRPQRLRSADR